MANDAPGPATNIFPWLRYRDAPAAMEWLVRAFGFEKQLIVPGPHGTIAHAQLRFGPGIIFIGSIPGPAGQPPPPFDPLTADHGIYVYVFLEDVDAHYARAVAAGAEILRVIEDTDYGSREYTARDVEGNLWSFGTYRPDAPLRG